MQSKDLNLNTRSLPAVPLEMEKKTSHGIPRKYRTDSRYLKKDTDNDVGIWNTEKYRIPTIEYRKVGSVLFGILCMTWTKHLTILQCSFSLDHSNQPLTRAEKVKDLGVWFDENLSFKDHIHDKINIAYMMLGGPDKTKFYIFNRARPVFILLYKSMVRSHLDYCCSVWAPYRKWHRSIGKSTEKSNKEFASIEAPIPYSESSGGSKGFTIGLATYTNYRRVMFRVAL